jgi:hypothetical protein
MFAWIGIGSWGAQEWGSFAGLAQAAVTLAAVLVALHQVRDIRSQNKLWRTLEICDRYHLEAHLVEMARRLRTAQDDGDFKKNPMRYRADVVTMLNYFDGIAIGIRQGLYLESLARDHLQSIIGTHIDRYLRGDEPKRLDIKPQNYSYILKLNDEWAAQTQPHFRDDEKWWHRFRRR